MHFIGLAIKWYQKRLQNFNKIWLDRLVKPVNRLALATLAALVISSSTAYALEAKCNYTDKTVAKTTGIIESTRNFRRETAVYAEEKRVCAVKIDVKIDENWQEAKGFYIFGPNMSENEACDKALNKAKVAALQQHAPEEIDSETEHVCNETIKVKEAKVETPKEAPAQTVNGGPNVFYHPNGNCYTKDTALYPHCHLFNSNSVNMHKSNRHQNNMDLMSIFNLGMMFVGQWTGR
jgi:hypothetical protein